jgi:tetratricopeptide (TPR) repeat protein
LSGEAINDPRKQAEFDRLMGLAHINRRRGEYLQADDLVRQALEVIPGNLDARELAADLLYARGQWPEASEAYKSIFTQDASRGAAEEKYAKVLLQISEGKRQKDLLQDMLEHPEAHQAPERSPLAAAVLSGIPGLGHVYCGEAIKGVVILAITAVSWFLFLVLRPDVSFYPPDQRMARFAQNMDPLSIIFLLLALSVHAYAVVNAAVIADRINARKKGTL